MENFYKGYRRIALSEEDIAKIYNGRAEEILDLVGIENEYLIVTNKDKDDEVVDLFCWQDGKPHMKASILDSLVSCARAI